MSEDADDSQKTEDPTGKRLEDARDRGQVASSREVNTWLMLLGALIVLIVFAPGMTSDIKRLSVKFIETPHLFALDRQALFDMLQDTILATAGVLLVPFVLLIAFALAAGLVQNGFHIASKALQMKPEKISPLAGAKRIASFRQVAELIKGLVKIAIVAAVAAIPLMSMVGQLDVMPTLDLLTLLHELHYLVVRLVTGVLAVMTVVALADYVFQRYQHNKQLRMTKQEVRDEYKQTEGDPVVKQKLRQIRIERARARMMQAVPTADVVVTNPTHFAVALKYDPDTMEAPKCVAKGQDFVALRIREVAEENEVTIVENPPLARALYGTAELDKEIPAEHYEAVAKVISYVWGLKRRGTPGGPRIN
ncbi:MAG: flagellar biosynthesis protein FlhB [Alphaproteobacteria bacterium]